MRQHKSITIKNQIIDKYTIILKEFFDLILQSESMSELKYPISSLYIGINSIHRVFEYVLLKTKSIEKAYYYSQRTYYYYLEYLEQIHHSNLSQNLNHMNAILFVYKKTIFDLYDGNEQNDTSNKISNIMTLNNTILIIDENEWRELFMKISKIINTIFDWNNIELEFSNRKDICENYLGQFLLRVENIDLTISYLEIIQQKMQFDYKSYEFLLKELLKICEINEKSKKYRNEFKRESDKNEFFLMKFYIEEPIFREKLEGGDMKDLVQWLYIQ
jgi:hypothetical protein